MTATPSKAHRVLAAGAAIAYAAGNTALAVFGFMLWRMHCEGFGCMGKGIAWLAWAAGFAMLLALGLVACRVYRGAGRMALRWILFLQAAAGVALVVYWATWRTP